MSYYNKSGWSESTKRAVWLRVNSSLNEKGRDTCGKEIHYSQHGEEGTFGWEVDHIYPKSKGGSDNISNLQPLFWRTNRSKGDSLNWTCP